MIGSISTPAVSVADSGLDRLDVEAAHLIERIHGRTEALQMLGLATGGDGRERAPVEGAFEGDQPVTLRRTLHKVIATRGLDRALDGLGTGIGEEYPVCKCRGAKPLGKPLLLRDDVQIGDVPELISLLGQRLDEMWMRMAERGHRHAAREIEIALARRREEIGALPARESKLTAGIGREEGRHDVLVPEIKTPPGRAAAGTMSNMARALLCQSGRTRGLSNARPRARRHSCLCSCRRSGRIGSFRWKTDDQAWRTLAGFSRN